MKNKRCNNFGIGYNQEDEDCINCKDSIKCRKETFEEQLKIHMGETNIKALQPIPIKNPIMFKLSRYNSKNVKMEIIINIEWLKKQLEGMK